MTTTLDRILNSLEASDTTNSVKVAAAPAAVSLEETLLDKVRGLTKTAESTTSAPVSSPVQDLQTMAKEAQAAEFDLLTKQSHFLGAALADGFMERFAQYDSALAQSGVKTAAALEPDTVKQIAKEAYAQARSDFEKQASEEYQRGYNDQMQQVHKIASELHYNGQTLAAEIVHAARTETK